nr:hypothetical protein BaRGS_021442 [Batillaria attramentaria]
MNGLRERLRDGEDIICAEGYMWELERRGYLKSGVFTPEVVLDHPERVTNLHEEYVHAGSDIVEAFTYYGHREKLRLIGREDELEKLNLTALSLARSVADKHGCLMAGNLSNTTSFDPDDATIIERTREIFKEQVEWAVRGGADMMIAETFNDLGEAKLALEAIQKYGNGIPAVVTLTPYFHDVTTDGVPIPQALRELEQLGADVGPLAALPVPFRTTPKQKTFQSLTDPENGKKLYPLDLACVQCNRSDIREFALEARDLGVRYVGLCCGSTSNLVRELALVYGRNPPSAKFEPDLSKNFAMGGLYRRSSHILSHMTGEEDGAAS